jgi:hypothetical protein
MPMHMESLDFLSRNYSLALGSKGGANPNFNFLSRSGTAIISALRKWKIKRQGKPSCSK